MLAQSSEFENMAVRDEELAELDTLAREACPFDVRGGPENKHGKVNILLQVVYLPQLLCADRGLHSFSWVTFLLCYVHAIRTPIGDAHPLT
jgi:activating signal cointegrator complex subunit 3